MRIKIINMEKLEEELCNKAEKQVVTENGKEVRKWYIESSEVINIIRENSKEGKENLKELMKNVSQSELVDIIDECKDEKVLYGLIILLTEKLYSKNIKDS